jgi:hypothetical protein
MLYGSTQAYGYEFPSKTSGKRYFCCIQQVDQEYSTQDNAYQNTVECLNNTLPYEIKFFTNKYGKQLSYITCAPMMSTGCHWVENIADC